MTKPLTADQMIMLNDYMARKQNGLTQNDIASQHGMSARNLRRILATDEAKTYMAQQAVSIAKESLGDVLDVVTKRALEGKVCKWAELYFRVIGILNGEPNKSQQQEIPDDYMDTTTLNKEADRLLASLDLDIDEPELKRVK